MCSLYLTLKLHVCPSSSTARRGNLTAQSPSPATLSMACTRKTSTLIDGRVPQGVRPTVSVCTESAAGESALSMLATILIIMPS